MKAINTKAVNKVFLGEENKGKGRYFKSRFIEAGLVQYDFGLCLLSKENLDKFVQGFVGCPVIIEHNEVYDDNAKELRVGTISRVWFDDTDGYYWCEGIIWDEHALDLIINKGWSVSCQYDITEVDEEGGIHNGVEFDKTILNGSPEHLALVDAPRYEAALIAVNSGKKKFLFNKAINSSFKEEEHPRDEAGKFTDKESGLSQKIKENEIRTKESEKQISREYTQLRVKEYQKSVKDDPKMEGVFSNDDGTWLLTEIWGKGKDKDGWDLVKGGKVIKHFNDRYEAYDAWDNGYFADIDSMDKQTAQNNKETEEMGIIDDLEKLIMKAKNKGDSMKSKNEDTDKRKLIDEVAGMMKSAGADDELIRTAIAKMEKLAYDKSEAGTADNKAKNEDEEDDKKEEAKNKCRNEEDCDKKDEKADNKCRNKDDDKDEEAENEDEDECDKLKREVDDEAKNKAKNKARNSISDFKKSFYDYDGGGYDTDYITQKKGIELGKQVF